MRHAPFLKDDVRYPDSDREFVNQTTLRSDFAWRVATDTAFYSSYAAYRDARSGTDPRAVLFRDGA